MFKKATDFIKEPFVWQQKLHLPLLALFLLINLLVLANALLHDPRIGYDTIAYLDYIQALADGRLPTSTDTDEFFSPPLAFIPSALTYAALEPYADSPCFQPPGDCRLTNFLHYRFLHSIDDFPLAVAAKIGQLSNVLTSLLLTFYLLKLCDLIKPQDVNFKLLSLGFLGILPVYYKTFAFLRAEPLLAALLVCAAYQILSVLREEQVPWKKLVPLGLVFGLIALTRQWGFAIYPTAIAMFVFPAIHKRGEWCTVLKVLGGAFLIALLVGGWFYANLAIQEGTFLAFNREAEEDFAVLYYPADFYFGLGLDSLFTDPVRSSLGSQVLPVFYTEIWGDYWAYFSVYGQNKDDGNYILGLYVDSDIFTPEEVAAGSLKITTNRYTLNDYLGRVNLVSLLPSLFLAIGFGSGLANLLRFLRGTELDSTTSAYALFGLLTLTSLCGYLLFLIIFTLEDPATIKATYMLQIFPFLAILAAEVLQRLRARSQRLYLPAAILLILTALHNLPTMITRHITW